MKISLIYPSRSRPKMCRDTFRLWTNNASGENPLEWCISCDHNDPELDRYKLEVNMMPEGVLLLVNRNRSAIDAVNIGAKVSTGDLLIVVSDDFSCLPDWDKMLVEGLSGKSDYVVKTDDGTQKWIITLPIMDRIYYQRLGYMYPPAYLHMFADTEMTAVGDMMDKTVNLKHILFEHKHYTTGKMPKDAINVKNDKTWSQGESMYLRRYRNDFFIRPDLIVGKIKDQDHIDWIKSKKIYA